MALVEILDNVKKVLSFIAIMFCCGIKGYDRVEQLFEGAKSKLLGLNKYQLASLED